MRSARLTNNKLLRDITGSVLVESTLVIPIFLVLVLGTIDVTYMFYEWALASKAAYVGARTAVVSDPVATTITNLSFDDTKVGQHCFDGTNYCSSATTVCTSTACTPSTWGHDGTAFTTIFTPMQARFPRLQPGNVVISYATNGLGLVGQPGGTPMNVTVKIQCMTHPFYFLSGLMRWAFTALPGCSPTPPVGPTLPSFVTMMQSEDMATN
jgi:Flp pilus assembly protein TadG